MIGCGRSHDDSPVSDLVNGTLINDRTQRETLVLGVGVGHEFQTG